MANNSIKAAFERMWQHVVTQLGTKADKSAVDNLNTLVGDTKVATQIETAVDAITPASIGAAASSHGTHVTWSTTTPKVNGTAAVGSETKVARGDHIHPTDTTRAAASDVTALQGLVGDTKVSTQISDAIDEITPASIGALPTSGGTVNGSVNMTGTLTVNGIKLSGYDALGNNITADKVLMVRGEDDHYVAYITPENICKQGITGGISSVVTDNFTTNRALVSNASGKIASSAITSTELGYLDGVTSSIQTQLDGKSASDHTHNALRINITGDAAISDMYDGSEEKTIDVCSPYHSHSVSDITGTLPLSQGGTGATTALDAANSLQVASLNQGTAIANGADLNTITTVGNYRCAASADSESLINCPCTGYLFTMKVGHLPNNPTYLYQEITRFADDKRYYRRKNGASAEWSEWVISLNDTDVIPLSKGGTGTGTDLVNATNNAIIRKGANGNSLYYTSTANGALYATSANGIPKFGTLPVAQGGTGQTSATTNVTITRGSDANSGTDLFGSTCKYVPYLGMCFVRIYAQPGATFNADTAYEIGTVSSSTYYPASMTALSYSGTKEGHVYINSSGKIVFTPHESITSSYGLRISGFWFV